MNQKEDDDKRYNKLDGLSGWIKKYVMQKVSLQSRTQKTNPLGYYGMVISNAMIWSFFPYCNTLLLTFWTVVFMMN